MTYSSLRFSRFLFSSVQSCILLFTPSLALENGDRFEFAWLNACDFVLMGCSGTPNLPPNGDNGSCFCSVPSEEGGCVVNRRPLIRVAVEPIHGCARMVLLDATAVTRVLLLLEAETNIGKGVSGGVESSRVCRVDARLMRKKSKWRRFVHEGVNLFGSALTLFVGVPEKGKVESERECVALTPLPNHPMAVLKADLAQNHHPFLLSRQPPSHPSLSSILSPPLLDNEE